MVGVRCRGLVVKKDPGLSVSDGLTYFDHCVEVTRVLD